MKITTTHINPPIPDRSFDWTACIDGEESGKTGYGKTEAEAIANISKVVEVKQNDFAPMPKRSSSGSYFRNNNGVMVEV